ncbi:MAG: IS1634 family transposase [Chthoniobacterales bacterium]|nr:IS1634 family transposase [Chthoniobacterales bacterium]
MHVAITRRTYKGKVYQTVLLRRTYREGDKVKHETLGNLSHLPPQAIDAVRRCLNGEKLVEAQSQFECVRSLPHGHVAATLQVLRSLGLEKVIASRPSRERDLVCAMIVARIIAPGSKLATSRSISGQTAETSLGELLEVDNACEDDLYEAMDWLLPRQARIENELAKRHLDNTLVLYDVTSTYFEGTKCPLAKRGHNRDKKNGKLQIVIGLLCNAEGCPIAVEVFEGNTGDPQTVASQVRKLRKRFGLERVVVVGDRGMLTEARIREDLQSVEGLSWITALRSPAIKRLVECGEVSQSLFDEANLAEITSADFPGERLMVCRNPLLAHDRARKREELLQATEAELAKISAATRRVRNRLKGADQIALKVGAIRNKHKVGKHFEIEISDESLRYSRKVDKIRAEAALDGIYVVRTNVPSEQMSANDTVRTYKSLSAVERAFRSMKTVDLKIRPIFHWKDERVKAHVLLCMLAYYVEWHMRQRLAPLLFDDHEFEDGAATQRSAVDKAERSHAAKQKAALKTTEDGYVVESFRSLLAMLGTIVKNWLRPPGSSADPFTLTTKPNEHQQRTLTLLDVAIGA